MTLRVCLLGLLAILVLAQSAPEAKRKKKRMEDRVVEELSTSGGTLEIVETSQYHYRVILAGKALTDEEGLDVRIAESFPKEAKPSLVVLEISSGGTGCPSEYRIIATQPGAQGRLTEPFGNCSDEPSMKMQGHILRIEFPPFHEAEKEVWQYDSQTHRLMQLE